MLIAAEHPLVLKGNVAERFQTSGMAAADARRLVDDLSEARLVGDEGAAAIVSDLRPEINTDHNRWMEYTTPRYQSSNFDWMTYNRKFLAKYK